MGRLKKKAGDSGMQRLSGNELRECLKLPVDEELSEGAGEEVRVLPDGRVLRRLVGQRLRSATPWPSREAFMEYRRRSDEAIAKQAAVYGPPTS